MTGSSIYYRLLHSPEHIQDWKGAHFHSYHNAVPGEWRIAYSDHGLRAPEAFSLDLFTGRYTVSARDAFLELAPKYEHVPIWTRADLKRVSQLDGVCAFSDLASLHHYAQGTPYGGMLIVEFEGLYVSKIPESDGGSGVLAKPTRTISVKPYKAL